MEPSFINNATSNIPREANSFCSSPHLFINLNSTSFRFFLLLLTSLYFGQQIVYISVDFTAFYLGDTIPSVRSSKKHFHLMQHISHWPSCYRASLEAELLSAVPTVRLQTPHEWLTNTVKVIVDQTWRKQTGNILVSQGCFTGEPGVKYRRASQSEH